MFRSGKRIHSHVHEYLLIGFALPCQICEWYQLYSIQQYSCAWQLAFTYLLPVFPRQSKFNIHHCNIAKICRIFHLLLFFVLKYILAIQIVCYICLFVPMQLAASLGPRFYLNIYKCKHISETGAQQVHINNMWSYFGFVRQLGHFSLFSIFPPRCFWTLKQLRLFS